MSTRTPRFANWHLFALAALAAVVIALAVGELGAPSSSARTSREVVTAEYGVVQTTVSGTGNVEPATDQTVNFATSGTLQSVEVSVGQHVHKGQLLATLDPTSATLSLDQAKADLTAAKDNLKAARDGTSTSSGSTGSGSGGSTGSTTASLEMRSSATTDFVSLSTAAKTTTTPTYPIGTPPTKKKHKEKTSTTPTKTSPTHSRSTSTTSRTSPASSAGSTSTSSGSSTSTKATKAQIAQDEASVDQAQATVDSDEQAVASTRLYAPVSGTIASLQSTSPGQSISAGGSSTSSSSTGNGSSSTGSTGSTTAGSLGGSSSGSSGSSGFAEVINSSTLTMTVAFSESDISSIHVGQPATVSIDALSGVELGAHVTSISPLATTSSSVVSYDATLTLDQTNPKVRAGMSASAAVITAQASGVTVPNQAISGGGSSGTVQLQQNGKTVSQPVVVGVRGTSRSQIVSGLRAGQQVVVTETLPALGGTSSSPSSSSGTGTLGGRRSLFGGGGGFPGAGSFPGAGGGFPGGG